MIGTTIGRYSIEQKIGEGGMATVYRAVHHTLGRTVAIKILHPHLSSSTRNRERFAREARAIEQLHHPNILEIYDYSGVEAAECWIATEYVDGETLASLLTRVRRIPSESASLIGAALADALAFAHDHSVLHRDLKPDNVMIRKDGVVKLMDFGIARFLDESRVTMTGALVGSPAFMSPEQAREGVLDARSDLFSLGTLLYLLVSGELPYAGSNPSIILRNIIDDLRKPLAEVVPQASASLCEVVERLLAPNPDERFADAHAVRAALQVTLDEVGLDATDPRWSIERLRTDSEALEADLTAFLKPELLERGKHALARGSVLTGLSLLNRLLEIDPEQPEALALVQGLAQNTPPPTAHRRKILAWVGVTLLALLALSILLLRLPEHTESAAPVHAQPATQAVTQASPRVTPVPTSEPEVTPRPEPSPREEPDPSEVITHIAPSSRHLQATPSRLPTLNRTPRVVPIREPPAEDPQPIPASSPAPPAPNENACIGFRSMQAPADVYLDGVRLRSVRDRGCQVVPPGTHTFVLAGPMIVEKQVTVTLAPGEIREPVIVQLQRLPATITFPVSYPDTCVAWLDRERAGTLASLGRELSVPSPDQPHQVELQCDRRTFTQTYTSIDYPSLTFDLETTP